MRLLIVAALFAMGVLLVIPDHEAFAQGNRDVIIGDGDRSGGGGRGGRGSWDWPDYDYPDWDWDRPDYDGAGPGRFICYGGDSFFAVDARAYERGWAIHPLQALYICNREGRDKQGFYKFMHYFGTDGMRVWPVSIGGERADPKPLPDKPVGPETPDVPENPEDDVVRLDLLVRQLSTEIIDLTTLVSSPHDSVEKEGSILAIENLMKLVEEISTDMIRTSAGADEEVWELLMEINSKVAVISAGVDGLRDATPTDIRLLDFQVLDLQRDVNALRDLL